MKRGICKLCRESKPLCQSHLIPEFLYDGLYDQRHRLMEFQLSDEEPRRQYEQKGYKEPLLCEHCDNVKLGQIEKYAAENYFSNSNRIDLGHSFHYVALSYVTMRLFGHSLLWRASLSIHPFFRNVRLRPSDELALRRMLMLGQPGNAFRYPIFVSEDATGRFHEGFLENPERFQVLGYDTFRFVFRGQVWLFIMADPLPRNHQLGKVLLGRDGCLIVPKVDISRTEWGQGLAAQFKRVPERLRT